MKDLMSLVAICKADLDSLGIKYGRVSNWTINTRAKCRLGQCRVVAGDLFDINISEAVLKDDIDDQIALDVIMHELLHTVKGCFNHGAKWKKYAEYINWKLPQYNIRRVATKGKSLPFLCLILFGYIAGITSKLMNESYMMSIHSKWYVLFFYVLNLIMVGADLYLYVRNYRFGRRKYNENTIKRRPILRFYPL